jgi:hypothetical protein
MQSPDEEKNTTPTEQRPRQDAELNETWRALLGLQASGQKEKPQEGDPAAQVQPLAGDPWSHLIRAQGMQTVDLQKINLHDLHPATDDEDVEHALNLMRESTGQLRAMNKNEQQAREKDA